MTINMTMLILIILIALVVQGVIEAMKLALSHIEKRWGWKWPAKIFFPRLNALFWAILLCFAAKAGFFIAFGFALSWVWLDYIVTGIVASLGAGKVYDLFVNVNSYKEKLAAEKATVTVNVQGSPPVERGAVVTQSKE